jgi:hypothetical protein
MDATSVLRIMSLIPERAPRAQSGCAFALDGQSERIALVARFLHWLGPLDVLTKEEQHFLGLRSNGGRPLAAGEEAMDEPLDEDLEALDTEEPEETPRQHLPGAGTQIAV